MDRCPNAIKWLYLTLGDGVIPNLSFVHEVLWRIVSYEFSLSITFRST